MILPRNEMSSKCLIKVLKQEREGNLLLLEYKSIAENSIVFNKKGSPIPYNFRESHNKVDTEC